MSQATDQFKEHPTDELWSQVWSTLEEISNRTSIEWMAGQVLLWTGDLLAILAQQDCQRTGTWGDTPDPTADG